MRLGLGTGSTAKHFVELLAERVRAGLDVVGVPTSEATRADAERLRRAADHARRDARARPDRRWRRRDRPGSDPDQGRRRRAAAREDRGGGLRPHGGDRRREQMGARRSAAFRCRSRSCRSALRRPGAPSRPRPRRPAARAGPRCGRARTATLSSRMAGTGYSMPRWTGSPMPKSLARAAVRHSRRRRARSLHRARASRHTRRAGRRSRRRAVVTATNRVQKESCRHDRPPHCPRSRRSRHRQPCIARQRAGPAQPQPVRGRGRRLRRKLLELKGGIGAVRSGSSTA